MERHRKLPLIPEVPSYQPLSHLRKLNSAPDYNLKQEEERTGWGDMHKALLLSVRWEAPQSCKEKAEDRRALQSPREAGKGRRAPEAPGCATARPPELCPQRDPDRSVLRFLRALLCSKWRDKEESA